MNALSGFVRSLLFLFAPIEVTLSGVDPKKTAGRPPTKFMIVDDHAGIREAIRAFLPEGIVTEYGDAAQALDGYSLDLPDWVLMDIELPGLDGLSATRQLTRRFPAARVIILTKHDGEEFRSSAREHGSFAFVHKGELEQLAGIIASTPSLP